MRVSSLLGLGVLYSKGRRASKSPLALGRREARNPACAGVGLVLMSVGEDRCF